MDVRVYFICIVITVFLLSFFLEALASSQACGENLIAFDRGACCIPHELKRSVAINSLKVLSSRIQGIATFIGIDTSIRYQF